MLATQGGPPRPPAPKCPAPSPYFLFFPARITTWITIFLPVASPPEQKLGSVAAGIFPRSFCSEQR